MNDEGHIYVFEAIIAGVLIITAILFLTGLSAPTQSESTGGIDLSRIAGDTLDILAAREAEDNVTFPNRLHEIVGLALEGNSAEADAFVTEVLPSGTRYLLRLDNGIEPLTLMPATASPLAAPRGAQAAQTYFIPNWTVHAADPDPATRYASPGDAKFTDDSAVDFSAWSIITGPSGKTTAPDGTPWRSWWAAREPGLDRIPAALPYGLWDYDGTLIRIQGNVATDFPVYAVQLLVWPGA